MANDILIRYLREIEFVDLQQYFDVEQLLDCKLLNLTIDQRVTCSYSLEVILSSLQRFELLNAENLYKLLDKDYLTINGLAEICFKLTTVLDPFTYGEVIKQHLAESLQLNSNQVADLVLAVNKLPLPGYGTRDQSGQQSKLLELLQASKPQLDNVDRLTLKID